MKTINSYNFSEILNGVKNGQVSNLYIISSQTFEDDANGETELKWGNEPYFAGATIEEATEVESDVYNTEYYDTYKEAVQHAKKLCKSHAYARIDLYQLNKSDCDDAADYEDEWSYNRGDHLQWTEKYENGVQIPVVYIGDREIWRWNKQGGVEDLKPRNVKRK